MIVEATELGGECRKQDQGKGSCHFNSMLGKGSLGRRRKEVRKQARKIAGGRARQAEGTVSARVLR